ncbi:MAG: type II toxin-antitoxin system VapC family toxin [Saprospiraceae bacterium]
MTYLIDTQVLIWVLEGNNRLSPKVERLFTNSNNTLWVSIASLWEIAIKISINKLNLTRPLSEIIRRLPEMDIAILSIEPQHILEVEKLPLLHRDPFDRIIIAQAIAENFEILSSDEQFSSYPIVVHW